MRMSAKQYRCIVQPRQQGKSKYKNVSTVVDGIRFDSKAEATYYGYLKNLNEFGQVTHFLRQVPFDLPGGVKYKLDFLVFYADGKVDYVDVKGAFTDIFILKKKQVEDLYPVKIRCLKQHGMNFVEVEK